MRGLFVAAMVVASLALLGGCSERPVGSVVADTPRSEWSEPVGVAYTNCDTLSLRQISIVARVESGHIEQSLPVCVRCTSPSGGYFESEVVLGAPGRHSGGSFTQLEGVWVERALLAERGDYLFSFTPADTLSGVWSVGVEIGCNTEEPK